MKIRNISTKQWNDSIIIFDTSSICKMYDMTDSAKGTMMEIIKYLKDRIFIPGRVWTEYNRNRIKVIHNPLKERYDIPSCLINTELKEKGKKFIQTLGNGNYYHPFISDKCFGLVSTALNEVIEKLARIKYAIDQEFKLRKFEINDLVDNDVIKDTLLTLKRGSDLSFQDTLIMISTEGEMRYRNSIPPGYMDANPKKGQPKQSIDAYGDLIVWKQILEITKNEKKDIIFICNDEKEDWWSDYEKTDLRSELIKEFHDETKQDIHPTNLEGFIYELEKRYDFDDKTSIPFYYGLEGVRDVLDYYSHFTSPDMTEDDVYAFLKCKTCGTINRIVLADIDFYWDENAWSELEMGPEYGYSFEDIFECQNCGEDLELLFTLIEYPAGQIDDIEVEYTNCEIQNDPNWRRVISPTFNREAEVCMYCGRHVHYLTHDMCDICHDDFVRKIEKD